MLEFIFLEPRYCPTLRGAWLRYQSTRIRHSRKATSCSVSTRSHTTTLLPRKQAALPEAEQNVKQLKASLDQVAAQAERADAQLQLTQQNYDRQAQLFKANVVAQATLDTATRNLDASKQTLAAATEVLTPPMFDV